MFCFVTNLSTLHRFYKNYLPKKMSLEWSTKIKSLLTGLNNFALSESSRNLCLPFMVNNSQVGYISPKVVLLLQNYPNVFEISSSHVKFTSKLTTYESRSKAIANVLEELRKNDSYISLKLWRDELYQVKSNYNEAPVFNLERCACPMFGVAACGAHMNGFVNHSQQGLSLWIATRSSGKQTYPGMFDNMVAGGISCGYGVKETLIKECAEEAGIPEELATKSIAVGIISYTYENELGIKPEAQFCFDLEVPETFQPIAVDGEVEKFELYPIEKVKDLITSSNFKPNSAAVTLDFLIRRGLINPDETDYYIEILQLLRQ